MTASPVVAGFATVPLTPASTGLIPETLLGITLMVGSITTVSVELIGAPAGIFTATATQAGSNSATLGSELGLSLTATTFRRTRWNRSVLKLGVVIEPRKPISRVPLGPLGGRLLAATADRGCSMKINANIIRTGASSTTAAHREDKSLTRCLYPAVLR